MRRIEVLYRSDMWSIDHGADRAVTIYERDYRKLLAVARAVEANMKRGVFYGVAIHEAIDALNKPTRGKK
jgi:hypothetical protein